MKSSKRSLNSTPIDLMAKQGHEYTKDYREFVLTLHLHGPKACKYLRETKHVPLPHPHTLLRWLRSVDAKPTSNKMMVDMLERRCQKTQRVLLSHALEEFHARGIWVACVTVDGHASNVSMCNQLGCELKADPREPLQTSFSHPVTGEKVFVMMAACHMLKLARNMLQLRLDMMIPFLKTWMLTNYLSALVAVYHFHSVINIDTLMLMIPELLQVQRYVLTYRFSQDHLELLFNSIRASGGWNNHPSARQFQAIFHRLMVRFGVSPGGCLAVE
ncbi:uncharacterized protein LOC120573306 isoform X2 [Perca fluviatilis]|uniref:uncharacterized protein LOC120573306 isoform X2 n=1 Tax=Perca fluviatilis TaxID=8168 RepID=UPI001962E8D4|nr:uncharacterized protein LOC120573306 isoform X2 [Perca fluviatilis]